MQKTAFYQALYQSVIMDSYIIAADLRQGGQYEGVILEEDIEQLSDISLNNLLKAGKDIIDCYCGTEFKETVPNMVKLVNAQLIPLMIRDETKLSESVDGYSYQNNMGAFSDILSKLDFLKPDGDTIAGRKKSVRLRIV